MVTAVDFGSRPPAIADLKAAGVDVVGRYFRPLRLNEPKTLLPAELESYRQNGIDVFLFYEGAVDTLAKPGTAGAILAFMHEAQSDLGLTERPVVYVSLDVDSAGRDMSVIVANMKVIAADWGAAKTAFYGDYAACKAVRAAGAASFFCLPGATAWGGGRPNPIPDWINLVQGGQYRIGDVTVDRVDVRTAQFGQVFGPASEPEEAPVAEKYVTYQGKRVTPYMAWVLDGVNAWLQQHFKLTLVVRDGIRTDAEQEAIFRKRYVTAGNVNGRRVYDIRWWNGVAWYRISPAGTVAVPGTSDHEVQGTGTAARAAVDIADSGKDAGITVRSSTRGRAIRAAASSLHIVPDGDNFGEGWHWVIRGIWQAVPGKPASTSPGYRPGQITVPGVTVKMVQQRLLAHGYSVGKSGADNIMGTDTIGALYDFQGDNGLTKDAVVGNGTWGKLKAAPAAKLPSYKVMLTWRWTGIQKMLKADFGYDGKIDNDPGPETFKALRRFLNAKRYSNRACGWPLAIKGIFTSNDCRSAQQWLKETKRYSGAIDGIPGAGTKTGWDRAEAENARAYSWVK